MANYNTDEGFNAWNIPQYGNQDPSGYNPEMDYSNMQNQQLDFQSFNVGDQSGIPPGYAETPNQQNSYYNPKVAPTPYYSNVPPNIFTPANVNPMAAGEEQMGEYDEPPLLEELEIYPERILMKTLAVLNPFHSHGLVDDAEYLIKDTDLAGPFAFCLVLAVCLFLSGKANFGYIYGLSIISCVLMYALLSLMCVTSGVFTILGVSSILGYCLLPTVGLSFLGIFVTLYNTLGVCLAILAVFWSSLSSSRLFVSVSGDNSQRPLIAYPCALLYGVFALLVVF